MYDDCRWATSLLVVWVFVFCPQIFNLNCSHSHLQFPSSFKYNHLKSHTLLEALFLVYFVYISQLFTIWEANFLLDFQKEVWKSRIARSSHSSQSFVSCYHAHSHQLIYEQVINVLIFSKLLIPWADVNLWCEIQVLGLFRYSNINKGIIF